MMQLHDGSKWSFAWITLLTAASLLIGCGNSSTPTANEDVDFAAADDVYEPPQMKAQRAAMTSVVVTVDGVSITADQIGREVGRAMQSMQGQIPPERMDQARAQIQQRALQTLIVQTLLDNELEKNPIEVTEEEIQEAIQELENTLPEGTTMDEQLANIGASREQLQEDITKQLQIDKLIKAQSDDITEPTAEDVRAFYDENIDRFNEDETVQARHILLSFSPEDDAEAKAAKLEEIKAIRERIANGEDFAALAEEYSDCPSKARGGDLGTFGKNQMVPAFEEVAFNQETGTVSDVVETRFGYHLVKVEQRNEARTVPFEEVSERIAQMLEEQQKREAAQEYIETLQEAADIKFAGQEEAAQE